MFKLLKKEKSGEVTEVTEPGLLTNRGERQLAQYLKEVYKPKNKILLVFWGLISRIVVRILDDLILNLLPENVKETIRNPLQDFVNEL